MIEFLLLDLDDTILDFKMAEKVALEKTMRSFGIEPTPENCQLYSKINQAHWEALERKELTREQVMIGRFFVFFDAVGIEGDAHACAVTYAKNLGVGHYFLPGAEEAVESLSKKYKIYIASNGTKDIQVPRLKSANIARFCQDIFISEDIGENKPAIGYFEKCFARIPGFDRSKAIIVGDSLSSDIQGGINAGIRTCWVNPKHKEAKIKPDYQIENITQLEALLETL